MLLCDGLSSKEIANELKLSPKTKELHRHNLGKKTGANEIALMVRWAIRHRLIEP
jgi:DNA-binding NarL/FixJ family response regulator